MSNVESAELLAAIRNETGRQPVCLAVIELSTPSSATLHVATRECIAGTQAFEAGLEGVVIHDLIEYLAPGPSPATAQFRLAARDYAALAPHQLGESLSLWRWKGARVTLYLWDLSLTDYSKKLQEFRGRIDTVDVSEGGVDFTALQDRAALTTRVASVVVDKTNRPNATDSAVGACIPVQYGDHGSPPLRGVMAGLGFEDDLENIGGGRGAVPLVLTDPGLGAAAVRVEAASHQIVDLYNTSGTCRLFMAGDGYLAAVDSAASTITETLAAGGSYADITDDALVVNFRVLPVDVRTGVGNNTATNPRRALDITDETSYATLDQGAGANKLDVILPNPSPLGKIVGPVKLFVLFTGDAANTQNLRCYVRSAGVSSGVATAVSTSTAGAILSANYPAGWYSEAWEFGVNEGGMTFGGAAVGDVISLCVDFAGAVAANKAKIYAVGIIVPAKPNRDLVTPGDPKRTHIAVVDIQGRAPTKSSSHVFSTVVDSPGTPDIYTFAADFFATLKGQADDGGGTYTGSAGALIQRVPDIVRHVLQVYGGLSSGDLVTGAGQFGSFVDARDSIRNASPADPVLAPYIVDKMTVQDVIKKVCEQGMAHAWEDVHDGLWRLVPWKRGAPVDYDLAVSWGYLIGPPIAREASVVDAEQEVRVSYLFDWFRGRSLAEAFVGESGSSQGWQFPTVRDQILTVTAGVNDWLDWKTGAWGGGPFTYADQLTPGTYEPIALASHVQSKLRTHVVAYYSFVGHGFTVATGFNDALEFGYGASNYQTTVPAGRYSADDLAHTVARLMNEAAGLAGVISGSYSHSTNKFTFSSSGSNINTIGPTTAVSPGTLVWPVMGWVAGTIAAASITAPAATYREQFWIRAESTATFQLMFGTGAHAATTCATLLGWPLADTGVAASQAATYTRNDRETQAAALRTEHGITGSRSMVADWIRDERTAVSLRDRMWDHAAAPPITLTLTAFAMPGLRRMQTFEVDGTLDPHVAFPRYGSDGTWSGKVMLCLGKVSYRGPQFYDEVSAVEA